MISMLRNDIVKHPTSHQVELLKQKKTRSSAQAVIAANQAALEHERFESFTEEDLADAKKLLQKEMEFVKQRIGHGDLHLDSYSKVWQECYAQVSSFFQITQFRWFSFASSYRTVFLTRLCIYRHKNDTQEQRWPAKKIDWNRLKIVSR
jgi:hypothetical protein